MKPKTGRPPRWCSTGCRRAAEYEVARLQRRLERLEERREALRGAREDGLRDGYGRTLTDRLRALEHSISEADQRLCALLDDADVRKNARLCRAT